MEWRRSLRRVVETLPLELRTWLRAQQRRRGIHRVPLRSVEWGSLRRLSPVSRVFGLDRGLPIDRHYIETFLAAHNADIAGRVLEIGDDSYTRRFGEGRVARSDVLHVLPHQPGVTFVADLTRADHIPADSFDCIICTQTIQMIYDVRAAVWHLQRMLKPGGVLLVTCHGTTKIARREGVDDWGEYWHLTAQSARRLFEECFPASHVDVRTFGNVLTATAFLQGLAAEELSAEELSYTDRDFEVVIGVRVVKPLPPVATA